MGSTSDDDLRKIAKFYNLPLIGVCQRDNLKDYQYVNNGFYIINTEPSSSGTGRHWQCLYLNKNTSFYFCSFGNPPPTDVVTYVKKYSKHLKNNNLIIQNINSENCGYFTIAYILFMIKNSYNYLEYINVFDDDTIRNDGVLEGLMRLYTNKRPIKEISKFFNMKLK